MKEKTILLTNRYDEGPLSIITAAVPEGFRLITMGPEGRPDLLEKAGMADYFLVSGRQKIDEELLSRAGSLKMIQRTGVGTDMIDREAVRKRQLPVYINRGVNAHSVAEHTVLLMLASLRNLAKIVPDVKSGIWEKQKNGVKTHELRGKTVGLIGLGAIGKIVTGLVRAFGAEVIYYDVFRSDEETEQQLGLTFKEFDEVLKEADIVSLHCPLTPENKGMLSAAQFGMMKDSAIIVNTARGGLIDQEELAAALTEGKIGAAALDVYEKEPVDPESPLLKMDNVLTTPHIGGVTYESFYDMMNKAMENIRLFDEGQEDAIKDKLLEI